jgi:crotonobetainyl-CoA:carnitine CoA-transferase CaiB-like acyl-CoA transferase
MQLLNRKNRWQRLLEPVAGASPGRSMVRSGLVTAGTVAGLTVVSAVISALRESKDER